MGKAGEPEINTGYGRDKVVMYLWAAGLLAAGSLPFFISSSTLYMVLYPLLFCNIFFLVRFSGLIKEGKNKQAEAARARREHRDLSRELEKAGECQKRLEKKLAGSEEMKNLGILAGSVAHDLNNILTGVSTYPEVLLMEDHLPPSVRKGIRMIRDSGKTASAIVSDLLILSRGARADKQVLNINTVIQRYMDSPEFEKIRHAYPGVEIMVETAPELRNISAAYLYIEKAVVNLIHNALQTLEEAVPRQGGKVTLSTANLCVDERHPDTAQKDLPKGEAVVLIVDDNGPAIPSKDLDKIFDPFYTRKEMARNSTGLGLTMVHYTVAGHGGAVRVWSGDTGNRFELYFPATQAQG